MHWPAVHMQLERRHHNVKKNRGHVTAAAVGNDCAGRLASFEVAWFALCGNAAAAAHHGKMLLSPFTEHAASCTKLPQALIERSGAGTFACSHVQRIRADALSAPCKRLACPAVPCNQWHTAGAAAECHSSSTCSRQNCYPVPGQDVIVRLLPVLGDECVNKGSIQTLLRMT